MAQSRVIGTTVEGDSVSVAPTKDGVCVLFSTPDDFCTPDAQVAAGHSVQISNDCSHSAGPMRLAAVLPPGAASTILTFSDGSTSRMRTAHEVAWFSGHVPTASEPYATSIFVADAAGQRLTTIGIPIGRNGYCPGE